MSNLQPQLVESDPLASRHRSLSNISQLLVKLAEEFGEFERAEVLSCSRIVQFDDTQARMSAFS
jgi:hypothetical protein